MPMHRNSNPIFGLILLTRLQEYIKRNGQLSNQNLYITQCFLKKLMINSDVNLDQPLFHQVQEQQFEEVLLTDKLYSKAYEHFQICVIISMIYSAIKACVAPFFIFFSDPRKDWEQVWLIIIIPISIFQLIYYWQVKKFANDKFVFLKVAQQVRHAAYFMPNQVSQISRESNVHDNIVNFRNLNISEMTDKEVKILSLEIKYEVLKQDWKIMIVSRILFAVYTALHIWGYIIFASSGDPNLADYYIIIVFFIGTYQYLEVYLGLIGFVIVVPFLLAYLAVKAIKQKRRAYIMTRKLEGKKYNLQSLKGQNMCHICMDEYKKQDMITVLQCNQMHHFHEICLKQWIRVSGTCPLCRMQIQIS